MQEHACVCINSMCRRSTRPIASSPSIQQKHTHCSLHFFDRFWPACAAIANLGTICTRLKHCPWHAHLKFTRAYKHMLTCSSNSLCSRPASELLRKLESSDPALFLSDIHRGPLFLVNVDIGILSGLGIHNPVDVKLAVGPPRLHDSRNSTHRSARMCILVIIITDGCTHTYYIYVYRSMSCQATAHLS